MSVTFDVFVSHVSGDKAIAVAMKTWLHDTFSGLVKVFVSSDGESISPGEDWRATVEEALRKASVALIVCTPHSVKKPWVAFEAGAAWMNGAHVVPVCYHGLTIDSLPFPFSSRQALDLGSQQQQGVLLNLIARLAGFEPNLIMQRSLQLPPSESAETEEQPRPVDVRVTIEEARIGLPGVRSTVNDLLIAGRWRPCLIVRAANHGYGPIFLEGGFDIQFKDSDYKGIVREVEGIPLLKRELRSGESIELPFYPDDMTAEELRKFQRVYFRDQIGRQFPSSEEDTATAIEKYLRSRSVAEEESAQAPNSSAAPDANRASRGRRR